MAAEWVNQSRRIGSASLRPVPIVVQVLSMKMNFDGLGKIILSIVIMSQALMNISIQWNIGKIIMLIVFVVSASVIRVCLNIVANSSSFWLKGSRNSLPHMVYTIWEFGKYPINMGVSQSLCKPPN